MYTGILVHKCGSKHMQKYKGTNVLIFTLPHKHKYMITQVHEHTNTQVLNCNELSWIVMNRPEYALMVMNSNALSWILA